MSHPLGVTQTKQQNKENIILPPTFSEEITCGI